MKGRTNKQYALRVIDFLSISKHGKLYEKQIRLILFARIGPWYRDIVTTFFSIIIPTTLLSEIS